MNDFLKKQRKKIVQMSTFHGARTIKIFGSHARDEAKISSDIDSLIELEAGRSLLDIVAIKQDLEDLLLCKVDVVTERALSPYLREQVKKEAIKL